MLERMKRITADGAFDLALARLGAVAELIGTAAFDRALYRWVSALAPVRVLFAIEVFADGRPGRVMITEGSDEDITRRARSISRDYVDADHSEDDVLHAHRQPSHANLDVVVQEGHQRHDAFRIKYYDSMGSPQEVSGFRSDGPATLYMGLSSMGAGYGAQDLDNLGRVLPLLFGMVVRHGQLLNPARDDRDIRERRMERLLRIQAGDLTERELQVCAMIVSGYRAEAIAARLEISPNTVATHRKNAYAKLRISSQSELFGILFTGWSDF